MIDRDNLTVETSIFCAAVSVAKSQWTAAMDALNSIENEIVGIETEIDSVWRYHNAGYHYKEIRFGHRYPGRAFEAANMMQVAISHVKPRSK